ncbi:hypothetical protein [Amycolatopsis sp. NPDC051071]|uniref:hypothetical protein n=1 Tax=Amycolatopsis sp. NPDC051071 TaxID=3154637 RepID=UPI0034463D37
MADPVTFTVLGSWAALEGIKFLYGQAAEVLKAWRERRAAKAEEQAAGQTLEVPVKDSAVLEGKPDSATIDATVLEQEGPLLASLAGKLRPYAQDLADLDVDDAELAEQAGQVRAILEAAYGQRFTFRGEQREPTGTRVWVSQVLDHVSGRVVGADAGVGAGGEVDVQQRATVVEPGGSVTGFTGRVGL